MRKLFVAIMVLALVSAANAQNRLSERTYLVTDRDSYVAGDNLWLSAFCVDSRTGRLSDFSSIAYVELHSSKGLVQTGKLALIGGRGAGRITLQNTLPTGCYKIIAYTAQSRNESSYDYSLGEKVISVFNTFTGERVSEGVEVLDAEAYAALEDPREGLPRSGVVGLSVDAAAGPSSRGTVTLANNSGRKMSLSVSVYHDDGIKPASCASLEAFLDALPKNPVVDGHFTPDYEGEVIRAQVTGGEAESYTTLISVPGPGGDICSDEAGKDGAVEFFTDNIYGDLEMVTEVVGADGDCHLELVSPFVDAPIEDFPKLNLCDDHGDLLLGRSLSMQIEKRFEADTLFEWLPLRESHLLNARSIRYRLDDYTRFPTMEEVLIEFVSELRARRNESGTHDIQVRLEDSYRNFYFPELASMILIDGVPVTDHEKVFTYDPALVESIVIYPWTFVIGNRIYGGLANFQTFKGNLPSLEFGRNVRVVSFQGASYPVAYTCSSLDGEYPDYRRTIYWHPIVELEAGESIDLDVALPSYSGRFRVVVEGISDEGTAVREYSTFEVN